MLVGTELGNILLMIRAGLPATIVIAGTSFVTTLPAPTFTDPIHSLIYLRNLRHPASTSPYQLVRGFKTRGGWMGVYKDLSSLVSPVHTYNLIKYSLHKLQYKSFQYQNIALPLRKNIIMARLMILIINVNNEDQICLTDILKSQRCFLFSIS